MASEKKTIQRKFSVDHIFTEDELEEVNSPKRDDRYMGESAIKIKEMVDKFKQVEKNKKKVEKMKKSEAALTDEELKRKVKVEVKEEKKVVKEEKSEVVETDDVSIKLQKDIDLLKNFKTFFGEDEYCYHDFLHDITSRTFSSKKNLVSFFKSKAPKVLAIITGTKELFICKELTDNNNNIKKLNLEKVKIKYSKKVGETSELQTISLSSLVQEENSCISHFTSLVFKPNNIKLRKGEYNLFTGFKAKIVDLNEVKIKKIQPILDHFKHIICSDNQALYDWHMNYFRVSFSGRKTEKVPVYMGPQGVGKSKIYEIFILPYVYGRSSSLYDEGLDVLVGQFNGQLMNTKLLFLNEIPSEGSKMGDFDKMKGKITGYTININEKNVPKFQVENYLDVVICTNHYNAIFLEKKERRYCIFDVKTFGTEEHYEALYDCIDNYDENITKECADIFLSYIMNYPVIVKLHPVPKTLIKKEIENSCQNMIIPFFDEIISGEFIVGNYEDGDKSKDELKEVCPIDMVPKKYFYKNFKVWCSKRGYSTKMGVQGFNLYISNTLGIKTKRIHGIDHYDLTSYVKDSDD